MIEISQSIKDIQSTLKIKIWQVGQLTSMKNKKKLSSKMEAIHVTINFRDSLEPKTTTKTKKKDK